MGHDQVIEWRARELVEFELPVLPWRVWHVIGTAGCGVRIHKARVAGLPSLEERQRSLGEREVARRENVGDTRIWPKCSGSDWASEWDFFSNDGDVSMAGPGNWDQSTAASHVDPSRAGDSLDGGDDGGRDEANDIGVRTGVFLRGEGEFRFAQVNRGWPSANGRYIGGRGGHPAPDPTYCSFVGPAEVVGGGGGRDGDRSRTCGFILNDGVGYRSDTRGEDRWYVLVQHGCGDYLSLPVLQRDEHTTWTVGNTTGQQSVGRPGWPRDTNWVGLPAMLDGCRNERNLVGQPVLTGDQLRGIFPSVRRTLDRLRWRDDPFDHLRGGPDGLGDQYHFGNWWSCRFNDTEALRTCTAFGTSDRAAWMFADEDKYEDGIAAGLFPEGVLLDEGAISYQVCGEGDAYRVGSGESESCIVEFAERTEDDRCWATQ